MVKRGQMPHVLHYHKQAIALLGRPRLWYRTWSWLGAEHVSPFPAIGKKTRLGSLKTIVSRWPSLMRRLEGHQGFDEY